jgi:hypothetical protein
MQQTQASVVETHSLAHAMLLKDLQELEEMVRRATGERLAELTARLGATRTHIKEHFRFEEQNGYMDLVRKREPRLERAVQHLAEEHRALALSLDALIEEAGARADLDDTFREQVREWIGQVRQHEARETNLIQDAFNFDVSAED